MEYVQLTDNVVSFNPVEDGEDNPEMSRLSCDGLIEKVMDVAAAACWIVILDRPDNIATDRLGRLPAQSMGFAPVYALK